LSRVVQQEAERSQHFSQDRKSPSRMNGCNENRSIDILEMLSKAKDEYERVREYFILKELKCEITNLLVVICNLTLASGTPFPSRHKHLTVEELFGTSLPKEQPVVLYPNPERMEKLQADTSGREHNLLLPFSFEQSTIVHQPLGKPEDPSIKTCASTLNQQECATPLLIAPAAASQPDVKNVSNYTVRLSPILNSASTTEASSTQMLPSLNPNNNIMQVMQQATKQMSPLMNQPPSDMNHTPQSLITGQSQFIAPLAATNTGNASSTPLPNVGLLQKLRLTPHHDQIQQQSLNKTTIAPNFSAAISQLATPESFKESPTKPPVLNSRVIPSLQVLYQFTYAAPPQFITATTTVTPSILLSPSVFQQSATKSTEVENRANSSSPLTIGATEIQTLPPSVLNRSQLQETLIHLIKNDSSFLSTLHEVYLQVLTKNMDNVKL
uniref:mRNA-decapping enzyme C-terminal domain-containing protein n=1 Tax=Sphenodon punctatus TaxID=8508 RepID=A0A8D0GA17_SPHPU